MRSEIKSSVINSNKSSISLNLLKFKIMSIKMNMLIKSH